jgi:hypothetical protein
MDEKIICVWASPESRSLGTLGKNLEWTCPNGYEIVNMQAIGRGPGNGSHLFVWIRKKNTKCKQL